MVHEMGNPAWASELASLDARLAHQDELDAHIAQWSRSIEPHALAARLQNAGVEACVVQTFDDLLSDPQLSHRGHWVPIHHSNLGVLKFERSGFRLSEGSGTFSTPGPNLGEHNTIILREVLGLSDEAVARLVDDEAVA